METLGDKILPKFCSTYYCKICDYSTCKKSSYTDHISSAKHAKQSSANVLGDFGDANSAFLLPEHICEKCNKKYKSRNGLWKHKKTCSGNSNVNCSNPYDSISDKDLIMMLIKDNNELRKMNCRIGVQKGVKNTKKKTKTKTKTSGLIIVYDMIKKNYRHINISGLRSLATNGVLYIVL